MKKISIARAYGAGALMIGAAGLASCGGSHADAQDVAASGARGVQASGAGVAASEARHAVGDGPQAVAELPALVAAGDSDGDEARALWLAMADDPLHHVRLAHDLLTEGKRTEAARQLEISAYLFRWGHLYAEGFGARRGFVATAQELEAAARHLRRGDEEDLATLNHTLSGGLRAMAELHATEVLGEWRAGRHTRAALLLRASADEVRCGFSLSGIAPRGTIERALADAGTVADRLDSRSPPEEREIRDAVEGLRDSASSLAGALGSRSS
jgi:hypothetical protein